MTEYYEVHCPWCESTSVMEILYGYPTSELAEAVDRGELALGGCVIDPEYPTHECKVCNTQFGRLGQEGEAR